MRLADRIMERAGFAPTDTGPNVDRLRAYVEDQVAHHGMTNMSGGTWADECYERDPESGIIIGWAITPDERARVLMEIAWEVAHGHSCETEVMDCSPINRSFDTKTMRQHYELRPDRILPWLRDWLRRIRMRYCIWQDRLLGRTNPYRR